MSEVIEGKRAAARAALKFIDEEMIVGIGMLIYELDPS